MKAEAVEGLVPWDFIMCFTATFRWLRHCSQLSCQNCPYIHSRCISFRLGDQGQYGYLICHNVHQSYTHKHLLSTVCSSSIHSLKILWAFMYCHLCGDCIACLPKRECSKMANINHWIPPELPMCNWLSLVLLNHVESNLPLSKQMFASYRDESWAANKVLLYHTIWNGIHTGEINEWFFFFFWWEGEVGPTLRW